MAGGAGVADPIEGGFEGAGDLFGVAFGLEADGGHAGFVADEHGTDGDDIELSGAEGVEDIVDFVVGEGELADGFVLAADAAEEIEVAFDAGGGGDFAHFGLDPEVGTGEADGEDAVFEGSVAGEGGGLFAVVLFELFVVFGGWGDRGGVGGVGGSGGLGGGGVGSGCVEGG